MAPGSAARAHRDSRELEILSGQVRLLYANANAAVGVSILAATILGRLQWGVVPNSAVLAWWLYMILLSWARYVLARQYRRASPGSNVEKWRRAFAAGAGLAGAGWGGAGILLYPETDLTHQVFLAFVLGGMMLGAASVLAPRPESFLAFLIPAGGVTAVRLVAGGDETHLAMGLLAAVFTLATAVMTRRIYRTLDSSLRLQFENRDLIGDLKAANSRTEALNEALELRVQERTAELRAEIAQRQEIEEELLRARKLESLGVLAGGIAHDFNNLLTIVQGNIEVAREELDPANPVQALLEETVTACRRASFLSSQLLTFAKGGAPVRRLVYLAPLVTDAVYLIRAGAAISVDVHIAPDLRPACVDSGQIGQVLHNILLNARQAMPQGGIIAVRAENAIRQDSSDPWVRISVRDHGDGIPSDVLPRIFDPYFTTKSGSSGLGLATAYAIVAKHGGHISAESKPGSGAVFTVDLPASLESPAPEPEAAAPARGGRERILVMDDEDALRNLLKATLTRLGYEVETARDGAEAIALFELAKAAGRDFDAVLLDLTVSGGMGGVETAARLKELEPSSKLIVSSGYSDAAVMSDFASYGFDAVIPKPWTAVEISKVFRGVLAGHPERKAD
jgi:signal transduction histidine kinase/ActR/RegA family two-component response regulator